MTIKAIETMYRGYRFRSRLEARWAVLFDSLDIKWEYETQGFELESGERYLPDFKFIGGSYSGHRNVWVEVKGSFDEGAFAKLIRMARELPPADDARNPIYAGHAAVLLLGNIPEDCCTFVVPRIDVSAAGPMFQPVFFSGGTCRGRDISTPYTTTPIGEPLNIPDNLADAWEIYRPWFDGETYDYRLVVDPAISQACTDARSARFEHGESGAPIR